MDASPAAVHEASHTDLLTTAKPLDSEVNGHINHHSPPADQALPSDPLTNGNHPHTDNLAVKEPNLVTQAHGFEPDKSNNISVFATESATFQVIAPPAHTDLAVNAPVEAVEPPVTSTVPPLIEQPISELRDDTTALPQSQTESAAHVGIQADTEMAEAPEENVAGVASVVDTAPPEAAPLTSAEDTPLPISPAVAQDTPQGTAQDTGASVDASMSVDEPVHQSVEDSEMTTMAPESSSIGQVRPRDEDDDDEPAAKRAKTDEHEPMEQAVEFKVPAPVAQTVDVATASAPSSAPATPALALAGLPPTPDFDSGPVTPAQKKFIIDAIRRSKKIKAALSFLNPVDVVALNIPTYLDYVKQPMDLTTMEEKLKRDQYESANAVAADVDLIVHNTITFNGAQHPVSQAGMNLRAHFLKIISGLPKGDATPVEKKKKPMIISKPQPVRRESRTSAAKPSPAKPAEPHQPFVGPDGTPLIRRDSTITDRPKREIHPPKNRDLPYSVRPKKKKAVAELKFCEGILDEVLKKKYETFVFPFKHPVDPVALNIPHYFKVIKKPMDLSTIRKNIETGEISNAKDFHAAFKLMLDNCFKFNPPEDGVHKMGKTLQELFDRLWADKERYLAEQMRGLEMESPEPESDAEMEEEEDDTLKMKRMLEIQQQIAALSQEAMMLSSGPLTASQDRRKSPKTAGKKSGKSGKSAGAPKPKRTNSGPAAVPAKAATKKKKTFRRLSLEQKRYVSEAIGQLSEAEMNKAVQIIRNGVPRLRDVHDDELELDIEEIPDDVVFTLYEFVRKLQPQDNEADDDEYEEAPATSKSGGAASGRKKNKPMSAREQESKIAQVQRKLQQFNGSGSEEPLDAHHADESSDDAPSESSEEE